jgi:hypothetical protein
MCQRFSSPSWRRSESGVLACLMKLAGMASFHIQAADKIFGTLRNQRIYMLELLETH